MIALKEIAKYEEENGITNADKMVSRHAKVFCIVLLCFAAKNMLVKSTHFLLNIFIFAVKINLNFR